MTEGLQHTMNDDEEQAFIAEELAYTAQQLQPSLQEPQPATNTTLTEADSELLNSERTHKPGDWYSGMDSPNPNGRPPKERSFTAILESKADKESIATELIAIAGDKSLSAATRLEAIKYIYARIEGSPVQAMRHSSDGTLMPLVFLHPGQPMIEASQGVIEATTSPVPEAESEQQN